MRHRVILLLLLLSFCFTSCDPGIGVSISNRTNTGKNIKVLYPEDFRFPGDIQHINGIRDSVKTYDLDMPDSYLHPYVVPRLAWDTIARTYSFHLMANHISTIESRFLAVSPTYGQVFIIDGRDTVELKKHDSGFLKRPRLMFGGTWTYTITDKR